MIKMINNYKVIIYVYIVCIFLSFAASYLLDTYKIIDRRAEFTLFIDFKINQNYFDEVNNTFSKLRAIGRAADNDGIKEIVLLAQSGIPSSPDTIVGEMNKDRSLYSVRMGKYFYKDFPHLGENIKIWGRLQVDPRVGEKNKNIVASIPITIKSAESIISNILETSLISLLQGRVSEVINSLNEFKNVNSQIHKDEYLQQILFTSDLAINELSSLNEIINNTDLIIYYEKKHIENIDTSIYLIFPVLTFILLSLIILLYRLIYEYRKKYFT